MRYGQRLAPEALASLGGKAPDQVLDHFLADEAFLLTLLDFNMFFFGYKVDSLFSPGTEDSAFDSRVFDLPAAINSVLAYSAGGDYLKLLDYQQAVFVEPLGKPSLSYLSDEAEAITGENAEGLRKLQPAAQREIIPAGISRSLDEAVAATGQGDAKEACKALGHTPGMGLRALNELLFESSIPSALRSPVRSALQDVADACDPQVLGESVAKGTFSVELREAHELWEETLKTVAKLPERGIGPLGVNDIQVLPDWRSRSITDKSMDKALGLQFFLDHANSSTNGNRRRAAYVLRTYFCDNLIPVAVVNLTEHTEGDKHASDPNCRSCHFKLDPMAGFFRTHGAVGLDFDDPAVVAELRKVLPSPGSEPIAFLFDDQTTLTQAEKEAFYANWKKGAGWDVGYIRSAGDPSRNAYGDGLDGLFKIIRSAPEVRQCLAQRLAEYFIGGNLTFDLAWMQKIAAALEPATNSSQALRSAVKLIVNSRAFRAQNPLAGECHDLSPQATATGSDDRPPYEFSSILEKNCVACHNSAQPAQGLDLSIWRRTGTDGVEGFSHTSDNGKSFVPPCESLALLKQRISSVDPATAMPPGGAMAATQKEKLFLWLEKRHQECQKDRH